MRFYVPKVINVNRETYPYLVCDGEQAPKTIAKFKNKSDAEAFLAMRRERYIKAGE